MSDYELQVTRVGCIERERKRWIEEDGCLLKQMRRINSDQLRIQEWVVRYNTRAKRESFIARGRSREWQLMAQMLKIAIRLYCIILYLHKLSKISQVESIVPLTINDTVISLSISGKRN